LVGLSPTEHTSFILDTLPYGGFSPVRLQGWPIRRCLPSEAPNCRAHLVCIPLSRSSLPNLFTPARCRGSCALERRHSSD
jgi:hypothetical protein